jgi:hypothetical protein
MLGKIWKGLEKLFKGIIIFIGIVVVIAGFGKCSGVIGNKPNYNVDISQYDSVPDNELYDLDYEAWKERRNRFDYEHDKKINSLSLKGLVDRKTDTYWRRLVGETVQNHKTFELEPKAPFYEPQSSVRCVNVTGGSSSRGLNRMFLNKYLMKRNLESKWQGDEDALEQISHMTCGDFYQEYFGK